eukprot:480051_1
MAATVVSIVGFIITCLLMFIFELLLALSLTYKFQQKKSLNELPTRQKVLRLSSLLIFYSMSIFPILILIRGSIDISTGTTDFNLIDNRLGFKFVSYILMAITYLSFHCYFLSKLYVTFVDSAYAIQSYVIYIHISFIILVILAAFIMIILVVFDAINALIGNILYAIIASFVVFPFLHLLFAFNRRLFMLCQLQQQTIYNIDKTFELSRSQQKLLSVVRKETLLAMLIFTTCILMFISYAIITTLTNGQYKYLHTYYYKQPYIFVFDLINSIGLMFGSLFIYLAFAVTKSLYTKLCNYFDIKCKVLCECFAKRTLKKHMVDVQMDDPVKIRLQSGSNTNDI